jgi:selenide,water dikinase
LELVQDPDLLVGFETSDDAAVYRLSSEIAVISTVDFITPPVDDPYWFGQIAAANSLSDVYAMGGKPHTALNLVMFPASKLDINILKEIMRGGREKVKEADAAMAGGHSVDDNEPKYGLAVTGSVHPEMVLTNRGVQTGDALILTKPLGTGVLFNANRSGKLPYGELEAILPQIADLNRAAIEVALNYDVHGCTDITGFGIVGHALEMARGSGLKINLSYEQLTFYPNAKEMYSKGETTGSNKPNRILAEGFWKARRQLSAPEEELLFDPQTSGGLLIAVPDSQADELLMSMHKSGVSGAARVGEVTAAEASFLQVV